MFFQNGNPSKLQVYGTPVNVVSHVTDVWRVDFMVKYGGIYVDTDVVFVRPLDRQIRGYDAIGSYDWTYWNHPFPDTINFGVALGKRNAPYWHKFQASRKRIWCRTLLRTVNLTVSFVTSKSQMADDGGAS